MDNTKTVGMFAVIIGIFVIAVISLNNSLPHEVCSYRSEYSGVCISKTSPTEGIVILVLTLFVALGVLLLSVTNNTLEEDEFLEDIGFKTDREKDIIKEFASRSDLSVRQLFKQSMRVYQFHCDNPTPVELTKLCGEEDVPNIGSSIGD